MLSHSPPAAVVSVPVVSPDDDLVVATTAGGDERQGADGERDCEPQPRRAASSSASRSLHALYLPVGSFPRSPQPRLSQTRPSCGNRRRVERRIELAEAPRRAGRTAQSLRRRARCGAPPDARGRQPHGRRRTRRRRRRRGARPRRPSPRRQPSSPAGCRARTRRSRATRRRGIPRPRLSRGKPRLRARAGARASPAARRRRPRAPHGRGLPGRGASTGRRTLRGRSDRRAACALRPGTGGRRDRLLPRSQPPASATRSSNDASGARASRNHCSDPAAESITPMACHAPGTAWQKVWRRPAGSGR